MGVCALSVAEDLGQAFDWILANDANYLPSDVDGPTPPADGTPGYFLNFESLSSLRLYEQKAGDPPPEVSQKPPPVQIIVLFCPSRPAVCRLAQVDLPAAHDTADPEATTTDHRPPCQPLARTGFG